MATKMTNADYTTMIINAGREIREITSLGYLAIGGLDNAIARLARIRVIVDQCVERAGHESRVQEDIRQAIDVGQLVFIAPEPTESASSIEMFRRRVAHANVLASARPTGAEIDALLTAVRPLGDHRSAENAGLIATRLGV